MNQNAILYFSSFLVVGAIIFVFILEFAMKKWKCNGQDKCVQVLGGDYDSEGQCRDVCGKTKVGDTFSEPTKTYGCVNKKCEVSDDGDGLYSTKSHCENECGTEVIVDQPYYGYGYGYGYGYPYYTYRRPYYWSPRRGRRRPRRRSHRPGGSPRRSRSRSPRFETSSVTNRGVSGGRRGGARGRR